MSTVTGLLTLEDFLALPEEKPALELIDGEVCRKPVPKESHSYAQLGIIKALLTDPHTAPGHIRPELGISFPSELAGNHRVPDVVYFLPDRRPSHPYPLLAPDLAVEIRSEGQGLDLVRKRLSFLRERGTRCTLLVDPATRTVEVHDDGRTWIAHEGERVTLSGLDGFSFLVDGLFEQDLP
jgi:Uma2 family endonuclease